jgi:hypothetical protein
MAPRTRWGILLSLLALSAGLVVFSDPPQSVPPTVIAASVAVAGQSTGDMGPSHANSPQDNDNVILEIRERNPSTDTGNAFPERDWTPPPPPPPPPEPPPPPSAPPLPFSFLGKHFGEGEWSVFLGWQGHTKIVKQGDVIDGAYRVDAIAPPVMTLTFLALKQQQTLAIGQNP